MNTEVVMKSWKTITPPGLWNFTNIRSQMTGYIGKQETHKTNFTIGNFQRST